MPNLAIYDTFDRVSYPTLGLVGQTSTSGHTWVVKLNNFDVYEEDGAGTSYAKGVSNGRNICGFDYGTGDVTLASHHKTVPAGGNSGIALRVGDGYNNCIIVGAEGVIKRVGGVETLLATTMTWAGTIPGTNVKVVAAGSSIKVWFDGVLSVDITETDLMSNTFHGIYSRSAADGAGFCHDFGVLDEPPGGWSVGSLRF